QTYASCGARGNAADVQRRLTVVEVIPSAVLDSFAGVQAMKTFVRCGQLFTGREDEARAGDNLIFDERGMLDYVGPEAGSPRRARGDREVDYSRCFVLPGLIDVHTHLAYGNAKSEEDIDLYSPLEFRTLRGMFFAQKVAAAGFTAICSPGDAGQISLSIRNAIRAGLFDGPRVMAA